MGANVCHSPHTHTRTHTFSGNHGGARNQAYGGFQVTDPQTGVSKYTSPTYAPNQGFDAVMPVRMCTKSLCRAAITTLR